MNKEKRNGHVLLFKQWVVYFSPFLCCTPQGMREKNGKYWVIFDSSTQTWMNEGILNQVTTTKLEAAINFGKSKFNLLINIYNWRIKLPVGNHIFGALRHYCLLPLPTTILHHYRCFWHRICISYQQVTFLIQIPQPALGSRSGMQ